MLLDLETTGLDVTRDRILEIALLRIEPDGAHRSFSSLVDPEQPVPEEILERTGLSLEALLRAPRLVDIAEEVEVMISGADLSGYNVRRYDVPLLTQE